MGLRGGHVSVGALTRGSVKRAGTKDALFYVDLAIDHLLPGIDKLISFKILHGLYP